MTYRLSDRTGDKYRFPKSEGAVQLVRYGLPAVFATLRAPEKGFATARAVVPLTFRTGSFQAALFIPKLGDFGAPRGNGSFHHAAAGGKSEGLDERARPVFTLMAAIVSF